MSFSFVCFLRGVCLSVCVRVIFSLSVSNNEKFSSDGALSNVAGNVLVEEEEDRVGEVFRID